MKNQVAAGDEHEEGGQVVANEEDVAGEEDEVVTEVHQEVRNAVIEDQILKLRVDRSEPTLRIGEEGVGSEENGGSAMEEGNEATGSFLSDLGAPVPENDEVTHEVDD